MAKVKVSDSEKRRNTLPGTSDNFDLELLDKYLNGKTIQELSHELYLAKGQVDMRIKIVLKAIVAFLGEKVPDELIRSPLVYRTYWLNTLKEYHLLRTIRNPSSQFSIFLLFFKGRTQAERIRMLNELEQYAYDQP